MKELILFLIKIGGMFGIVFGLLPLMIWGERKGAAYIQNRPGPNRAAVAGFTLAGLFHPLADVIKLMTKEEFIPAQANRVMLILAPCFAMGPALMTFAVVPWGGPITIFDKPEYLQVANLDVGILYVFAISSLGVFGIMLAGWASNNKYSLLGGLRSSAQMLSYEIAMGLSIVGVIMIFHSVNLNTIVAGQGELLWGFLPKWGIFVQPIGFFLFLTAAFAETNRNPFDLPEGESELVAGYHTEYTSMKFAMFFMAEYANIIVISGVIASLFLGGWQVPWPVSLWSGANSGWWPLLWFVIKVWVFLFVFIWLRTTLPRLRYDQFMTLGWKVLIPFALAWVLVVAVITEATRGWAAWSAGLIYAAAGLVVTAALLKAVFAVVGGRSIDSSAASTGPEGAHDKPFDPFAGGFPVPPLPGQVLPKESADA